VVTRQIKEGLAGFSADEFAKFVVAYEPVWAIGTGETASPEQAEEMHKVIRGVLTEMADEDTAESIAILYGGSMKPGNAEELLKQTNVDGGLIGGASLKTDSFTGILEIAEKLS
jgi:triosephosphate isomerase